MNRARARAGALAAAAVVVATATPAMASNDTVPVRSRAVRLAVLQAGSGNPLDFAPLRCWAVHRYVGAPSWFAYWAPGTKPGCHGADGATVVHRTSSGYRIVTGGSYAPDVCQDLRRAPAPVRAAWGCG